MTLIQVTRGVVPADALPLVAKFHALRLSRQALLEKGSAEHRVEFFSWLAELLPRLPRQLHHQGAFVCASLLKSDWPTVWRSQASALSAMPPLVLAALVEEFDVTKCHALGGGRTLIYHWSCHADFQAHYWKGFLQVGITQASLALVEALLSFQCISESVPFKFASDAHFARVPPTLHPLMLRGGFFQLLFDQFAANSAAVVAILSRMCDVAPASAEFGPVMSQASRLVVALVPHIRDGGHAVQLCHLGGKIVKKVSDLAAIRPLFEAFGHLKFSRE